MSLAEQFITNMTSYRKARGISQAKLGTLSGVGEWHIRAMEQRRRVNPTLKTVQLISDALGVDSLELLLEPDAPAADAAE